MMDYFPHYMELAMVFLVSFVAVACFGTVTTGIFADPIKPTAAEIDAVIDAVIDVDDAWWDVTWDDADVITSSALFKSAIVERFAASCTVGCCLWLFTSASFLGSATNAALCVLCLAAIMTTKVCANIAATSISRSGGLQTLKWILKLKLPPLDASLFRVVFLLLLVGYTSGVRGVLVYVEKMAWVIIFSLLEKGSTIPSSVYTLRRCYYACSVLVQTWVLFNEFKLPNWVLLSTSQSLITWVIAVDTCADWFYPPPPDTGIYMLDRDGAAASAVEWAVYHAFLFINYCYRILELTAVSWMTWTFCIHITNDVHRTLQGLFPRQRLSIRIIHDVYKNLQGLFPRQSLCRSWCDQLYAVYTSDPTVQCWVNFAFIAGFIVFIQVCDARLNGHRLLSSVTEASRLHMPMVVVVVWLNGGYSACLSTSWMSVCDQCNAFDLVLLDQYNVFDVFPDPATVCDYYLTYLYNNPAHAVLFLCCTIRINRWRERLQDWSYLSSDRATGPNSEVFMHRNFGLHPMQESV